MLSTDFSLQVRPFDKINSHFLHSDRHHDRLGEIGWLRGTGVERRSLAGELSLSCARPVADGDG